MNSNQIITTLEEFLAHALMLEQESLEHYEQLADSMAAHHNHEVAELFRELSHQSARHLAEVEKLCHGRKLPRLAPWEYHWQCPGAPAHDCMAQAHYLMQSREALILAIHNEQHAAEFYRQVSDQVQAPHLRRLARQFADQERAHCDMLRLKLSQATEPDPRCLLDTDPPNLPE